MVYTLLICNGEMPRAPVLRHLAAGAQFIVCADGGANAARDAALLPDTVIGDFDSITRETRTAFESHGVELRYLQRQDDTDFEKALKLLVERRAGHVVILGLTGKLLDHTLGNFSILLRYIPDLRFSMFDRDYRMDILTHGGRFRAAPGDRVSVVPLRRASNVRYTGLRFPLDGVELAFGKLEGTCNEALDGHFEIAFDDGILLLFRQLHTMLIEDLGP
ncbi:MAG: thiamine diphosphokinase [Bacteroidetes bacterium]|nr:thiamine diphosphokinase [Bacteroidota bacterium]